VRAGARQWQLEAAWASAKQSGFAMQVSYWVVQSDPGMTEHFWHVPHAWKGWATSHGDVGGCPWQKPGPASFWQVVKQAWQRMHCATDW
jgi:hypothetical protein